MRQAADNDHVHLWYTDHCYTQISDNPDDFMSITLLMHTQSSKRRQINTCYYGVAPFKKWQLCSPPDLESISGIVATVWDQQRNTLIILSYLSEAKITVRRFSEGFSLHKEKAFPEFHFPDTTFFPVGMFMYPSTYYLYVYGSQITKQFMPPCSKT
ncbi:cation channel sperm-associated auxiliary subunit beta-like [Heterodontus francisci]|uniref:cation channel sperm-associated auxiliary subunit beta-like n=1 Tax=Heterodontus francisci TaxID=7792 RepID=UPI00355B1FE4